MLSVETVQKAAGCLVEYLCNTCWYWLRTWTNPQQLSTEGDIGGAVAGADVTVLAMAPLN